MGRPKSYDREEVLENALLLFWRKGFEGAHLQELVEVTGLNRFSLYKEFGSKEGLFDAAMKRYMDQLGALAAHLSKEPLGTSNIRDYFQRAGRLSLPPRLLPGQHTLREARGRAGDLRQRAHLPPGRRHSVPQQPRGSASARRASRGNRSRQPGALPGDPRDRNAHLRHRRVETSRTPQSARLPRSTARVAAPRDCELDHGSRRVPRKRSVSWLPGTE